MSADQRLVTFPWVKHEQWLDIVDHFRERLELREDAIWTSGVIRRDTLNIVDNIRDRIAAHKPVSYQKAMWRNIFRDSDEDYRWCARQALENVRPLIKRLEGAGYEFVETKERLQRRGRGR